MQRPPVLPDTEIQRRLAVLPGWERQGNALRRTFTFRGFPEAVEFIRSMVRTEGGHVLMTNDKLIPIGRSRRKEFSLLMGL